MLSTSRHHRICEQLTIIEVHMHISALHTLCNLKIHKIHATGRETFCTFHYSRIWVRLLPSLFHVHIFLYAQWLHTSPSHRLCTWVREMVLHLTITQAAYMGQRWFYNSPSHRLCECIRDLNTHQHGTRPKRRGGRCTSLTQKHSFLRLRLSHSTRDEDDAYTCHNR